MSGPATPDNPLQAVDVNVDRAVVTATILGTAIEQHRAAAILDGVRVALAKTETPVKHVVVDLGEVQFINSTGLAAFVELHNELKDQGANVIAYRPSAHVRDILSKVRLDKLCTIVDDAGALARALG